MRLRNAAGFTLVELLIAAVITVIALLALGGLFADAGRTFSTSVERSASFQDVEGAIAVLRRDLALEGFPGDDATPSDRPFAAWTGGTTLRIERTAASDRITAFYLDDRYTASGNVERHETTFALDPDRGTLDRTLRTPSETFDGALIGGVSAVRVVSLVRKDRSTVAPSDLLAGGTVPDDVVGLEVRIDPVEANPVTFLIATFNPQSVEVTRP